MRILFINNDCGVGSTGRICIDLARQYENEGHECAIAYGRDCKTWTDDGIRKIKIGNKMGVYFHALNTRLFDNHGLCSKIATRHFLNWADSFEPDIVWLHNIHGYFINYEMLFSWLKSRPDMQVKWTLHDCWSFTGHCGYYTMVKCEKWKEHCQRCPIRADYPSSLSDNSYYNFERKKSAFLGIKNMQLITPSIWLADEVKQSFMGNYPVKVVNNKIDTSLFKPTESDFRKKNKCEDKTVILGVANVWHRRKGLNDFIELASMLSDKYVIVLVGLNDQQIKNIRQINLSDIAIDDVLIPYEENKRTSKGVAIPENVFCLYQAITGKEYKNISQYEPRASIIPIKRTNSTEELAGLYSMADIFINPTHEENYPTTNLEAISCHTWVITYDVGGSRETI